MSLKFPSNGTQPNPQQKQPSSPILTGIPTGLRWKSKQKVPLLPNVGLSPHQFQTPPWLYSWGSAQTYTSQTPSLSQCWLSSSPGILPAGNTARGPIGDPSSIICPASASGLQQPPAQILPLPPALPHLRNSCHSQPLSKADSCPPSLWNLWQALQEWAAVARNTRTLVSTLALSPPSSKYGNKTKSRTRRNPCE